MTRYQLVKLAESFGAKILDHRMKAENFYRLEAEAPDGQQWSASDSQVLVSDYWPEFEGSEQEAREDLAERMNYGLEPIQVDS